jgi:hypothetical protein
VSEKLATGPSVGAGAGFVSQQPITTSVTATGATNAPAKLLLGGALPVVWLVATASTFAPVVV